MPIDPTSNVNAEQSQYLTKKRKENEDAENNLILEKARIERQRLKELSEAQEKTNQNLVAISKEGEALAGKNRNLQKSQMQNFEKTSNEHFEKLSKDTAERIRTLDQEAKDKLLKHQLSAMEKVKLATDKAEDPFYRQKSFQANIAEREKDYEVKIKLPPHEAENLFIRTENNTIKLSLARSFADKAQMEDGHQNRTSSYQTILESYTLPTHLDSKNMQREYKDGMLTITIGKLI